MCPRRSRQPPQRRPTATGDWNRHPDGTSFPQAWSKTQRTARDAASIADLRKPGRPAKPGLSRNLLHASEPLRGEAQTFPTYVATAADAPSPIQVWRPSLPDFFFNDTATTEIYTLSLHDALPI